MQENAYEYVVWEMAAILSRPQCVNKESEYVGRWWLSLLSFSAKYKGESTVRDLVFNSCLNIKTTPTSIWIPIINIRLSGDRLML